MGTTQLPGAGKAIKKDSSMLGPPNKAAPNPRNYLKGGTNCPRVDPRAPAASSFRYDQSRRKPMVPSMEEKPVMGPRTTKNFITANAVEAIYKFPRESLKSRQITSRRLITGRCLSTSRRLRKKS